MRIVPIVIALIVTSFACTEIKDAARAGASILVDCTKGQAAKVVSELGPTVDSLLLESVDSDGKVDWQPVKDLAKGWTADIGGCVLSDVVARALKPRPEDPNAPKSSPLDLDLDALAAGFAKLRAEQFPGVTFRTSSGEL